METNELLGQLKTARLEDDLTYEELADQIGVDPTALNRLLNGVSRTPHDRTVFKITRFLEARRAKAKPRPVSA